MQLPLQAVLETLLLAIFQEDHLASIAHGKARIHLEAFRQAPEQSTLGRSISAPIPHLNTGRAIKTTCKPFEMV
jgi:hypothetical protein